MEQKKEPLSLLLEPQLLFQSERSSWRGGKRLDFRAGDLGPVTPPLIKWVQPLNVVDCGGIQ